MPVVACSLATGALNGALLEPVRIINIIFLCIAVALLAGAVCLGRLRAGMAFVTVIIAAFLFGLSLAGFAAHRAVSISIPLDTGRITSCRAVVVGEPQALGWGCRVDVRLIGCRHRDGFREAYGVVRLNIRRGGPDLTRGDRIEFSAKFGSPREFKNPGSFPYQRYLMVHGIAAVASARGKVGLLARGELGLFSRAVSKGRRLIAGDIERYAKGTERTVVSMLAIGDPVGMEAGLRDAFAQSGLSHILSISGLHVGYIAILIYFLARLIFRPFPGILLRVPLPQLSAAVTIPAVWAYVALAGFPIAAVRAAIMICVYLVGVISLRRQDLLTTLAVAVMIILIATPLSILDISFQLSAVAVAGIIVISPLLMRFVGGRGEAVGWVRRSVRWLAALVAISVSATIVTAPLVAYNFKMMTAIGLISNIVAVPLAGFVIVPAIAAASVASFALPGLAAPLWRFSAFSSGLLVDIAQTSSKWGSPLVIHFAPTVFEVVTMYALVAVVVFWKFLPYRKMVVAALIVMGVGSWGILHMPNNRLEVTFLDVGQGDSALVEFPTGQTMLIDGGGIKWSSFDVGRNVVAPALWREGVHGLDWVVLTHPHHDHYRGLGYIAEQFGPKLIWTNGLDAPEDETGDWDEFLSRVRESGVPLRTAGADFPAMDIGGAKFRLIRPPYSGDELNDTSLVVDISYGRRRFLIVGDLSEAGEQGLMALGDKLEADVLKVGHHGSKDASTDGFLSAVRPAIAVISVGAGNKYGMPDREAMERLNRTRARIYRTDLDGAVTVSTDGNEISVRTFVSGK